MLTLRLGDKTLQKSYAGMINEAIGTNYKSLLRCTVDLQQFDVPKVIAWFVYMDDSVHGYPDGWQWRNTLSADGNTIIEEHVSSVKETLKERQIREGYNPYRLCFQRDYISNGNGYWCKFVGVFRFSRFLSEKLDKFEFVKVLDEFTIGSKGDGYNPILNSKNDFLVNAPSYKVSIENMNFSESVSRLLKKGGIETSGDLLELGIKVDGPIATEIRQKLYEHFY